MFFYFLKILCFMMLKFFSFVEFFPLLVFSHHSFVDASSLYANGI